MAHISGVFYIDIYPFLSISLQIRVDLYIVYGYVNIYTLKSIYKSIIHINNKQQNVLGSKLLPPVTSYQQHTRLRCT